MRGISVFLLFVVVFAEAIQDDEVLKQWNEFQTTHKKTYRSPVEERTRFAIFRKNLYEIEEHNHLYEQGKTTYTKGVNQFTDWTKDEFLEYVNRGSIVKSTVTGIPFKATEKFEAPTSVDWRSKNVVTPVKTQGGCQAGWAFSATGAVESQLAIRGYNLVSLSEQNLLDCSGPQGNSGCLDGSMNNAFQYIKQNGIEKETDYPYKEMNASCKADPYKVYSRIYYIYNVQSGSDSALIQAVATKGPISVAIDATNEMQMYKSGILNDRTCNKDSANHGVLLVGYGTENGKSYWLIKNSWGTVWGERGYLRLTRSRTNECGISSTASYVY